MPVWVSPGYSSWKLAVSLAVDGRCRGCLKHTKRWICFNYQPSTFSKNNQKQWPTNSGEDKEESSKVYSSKCKSVFSYYRFLRSRSFSLRFSEASARLIYISSPHGLRFFPQWLLVIRLPITTCADREPMERDQTTWMQVLVLHIWGDIFFRLWSKTRPWLVGREKNFPICKSTSRFIAHAKIDRMMAFGRFSDNDRCRPSKF